MAAGDAATYVVGPELSRTLGEPADAAERLDIGDNGAGLFAARQQVKVDLLHGDNFRAGALASRPAAGGLTDGNPALGGGAVGAFAEYNLDAWRMTTSALQSTAGGHGSLFAVSVGYGAKISSNISLAVGPNFSWSLGGDRFAGELGSGALGVAPRHELDGGSRDVGASITVNWHFLDSWNLTGVAGAKQLLSSDGEISAAEARDALKLYTGISVGYRF